MNQSTSTLSMQGQKIFYKSILFIIIGLACVDIFNSTYSYIWVFCQLSMTPNYFSWLESLIINIILVVFLLKKRTQIFGLAFIILYLLYEFDFLYDLHGLNPMVWFHNGSPIQGVFIFIWVGEIILALTGIFLWLKFRKSQSLNIQEQSN